MTNAFLLIPGDPASGPALLEMALRAVCMYTGGFILIRLGKNRLLGRSTPFDIVLGVVIGSLLSRAINGGASLTLTLAAAVALIAFHSLVSWSTARSRRLERVVKGDAAVLLRDGEPLSQSMRRADITDADLDEALRLRRGVSGRADVAQAALERNGQISVVKTTSRGPRVVDVRVAQGVQTVRIELA